MAIVYLYNTVHKWDMWYKGLITYTFLQNVLYTKVKAWNPQEKITVYLENNGERGSVVFSSLL